MTGPEIDLPTRLGALLSSVKSTDPWGWATVVLFATSIATRIAVAFPVHKFPGDADALLCGLCAFRVLGGATPVFLQPLRLGSIECYLAAALFALGSASRAALMLTALIPGCAAVGSIYLLTREMLGRQVACVALLVLAVPPAATLFWTYVPMTYATTLFLNATALWLAVRIAKRQPAWLPVAALGLTVGLGWWTSVQTVACSLPACAWLFWRQPAMRTRRWILLLMGTFLLGASPWIAFNLRYGFPSFGGTFATRHASGIRAMASNAKYVAMYDVPELMASMDPENLSSTPIQRAPRPIVLSLWVGALLLFFGAPRVRRFLTEPSAAPERWLVLGVLLTTAGLNVISQAGETRGLTVRYVLPMWTVLPAIMGFALQQVVSRSRSLAAAAVALLLGFNALAIQWPGRPLRQLWHEEALADERLVDFLTKNEVAGVLGHYWASYPINFLSHERIVGVPCELGEDFDPYNEVRRLPSRGSNWAFLAFNPNDQPNWVRDVKRPGSLVEDIPPYAVFVTGKVSRPPSEFVDHWTPVCRASVQ